MDNGFFATLNQLIQSHPGWLVAMAFAFALLESLAIIGIFIPGIVLLFIVGAVVGMDLNLFLWCWASAAAGALVGDVISHWAGYRFRVHVPRLWPLSRRPDMLAAGQAAVLDHGGKAIIIGRFVGPLRPVVPMVAGMMSMPMRSFLLFAIPACILWAPAYLLPGMLFGASLELAAEFAGRLVVVLLIVVLGGWLVLWATRLVYNFTARRSGWWLRGLIRWSSEHPLLGRAVAPLFEPGKREMISVALLGLLLLVSVALLLAVLLIAPFAAGTWDAERQVASWAASLRSHLADPYFVVLSLGGDLRVMGLLAAIITLVLIAYRRSNAAWHWLVAGAGAWILAEMLGGLMGFLIDAPEAMPSLGEVPHRGTTVTTAVLGFFAVMIAKDLDASRRKWPYLFTSLLLMLVCFAHLYLGRASVSGVAAALALGGGWVALVGIGYRQRSLPRQRAGLLALAFYGLLVVIAGLHAQAHMDTLLETTRLAQPERTLSRSDWLEGDWEVLPARRSRFGPAPVQRFDLQVAANLHEVARSLERAGWEQPPQPRDRLLPLLIGVRPDPHELPHLPRDFAGRPENLIRMLPLDDGQVAVLRLWASGARLDPGGQPVWLGQVRVVRAGLFLGIFNRWQDTGLASDQVFALLEPALADFQVLRADTQLWLIVEPPVSARRSLPVQDRAAD
jgi:membrane protein DedA with SNARE-associated domain